MFPEMRRYKQQISEEECLTVLKNAVRGVLSVSGDDGYPYGLPIDFWYDEATGIFYFHGAKTGHKIRALERSDRASMCVLDEGYRKGDDWALNIRSVIAFGRLQKVTDPDEEYRALAGLVGKFPAPEGYLDYEIKKSGKAVQCLKLVVEHMTGKLVNEA